MSVPIVSRLRQFTGLQALQAFLGGWTLLVFAFLYAPIAVLVVYSLNQSRLNITWTGFTTRWYADLVSHTSLMKALKNSLIIAGVTTVLASIFDTLGA